jgi:hypothetical protein
LAVVYVSKVNSGNGDWPHTSLQERKNNMKSFIFIRN